ncbi:hypothetical protein C7967_11538 [Thalassospira sp. 11-3]|nr:hypothetical protein C7967_11538 [Thalassospira sp. 11-3]
MSGNILQAAKADAKKYITAGGFQEDLTIKTPDENTVLQITGFATKHHINFDSDGNPVNSKNVHICISESDLVANSYQVRNAKGEVALINHRVTFKDSSGLDRDYIIKETLPDETLGLITCILGDFKSN